MSTLDHDAALELRAVYDRWLGGDLPDIAAFLREALVEDWVYTDTTGHRRTRERYIADVLEHAAEDYGGRIVALEARRLGDYVLVLGEYHASGTFAGQHIDGSTLITAVWRKESGGWRCQAHHSTDVVDRQW